VPERRARRLATAAALAIAVLAAVPGSGHAQTADVSSAELRSLAARATEDATALARLRRVTRVDGRQVDMQAALGSASGADLRDRLRILAASPQGASPPAIDSRREAGRILDGARYHEPAQPRPLRGLFRWLGQRLEPVARFLAPIGRPFAAAYRAVTGSWKWSLLVGGAVALAALYASLRLVGRRGRKLAVEGRDGRGRTRALDPDTLEREADEAAAAGRFDAAFRLRFLAGLVRLDRAGVVELRPSLTSGALRRKVPSSSLRALTLRFDEIVYGGREAGPDDVEQARREWPRALDQVGS
jgi:hypothetical protein